MYGSQFNFEQTMVSSRYAPLNPVTIDTTPEDSNSEKRSADFIMITLGVICIMLSVATMAYAGPSEPKFSKNHSNMSLK